MKDVKHSHCKQKPIRYQLSGALEISSSPPQAIKARCSRSVPTPIPKARMNHPFSTPKAHRHGDGSGGNRREMFRYKRAAEIPKSLMRHGAGGQQSVPTLLSLVLKRVTCNGGQS